MGPAGTGVSKAVSLCKTGDCLFSGAYLYAATGKEPSAGGAGFGGFGFGPWLPFFKLKANTWSVLSASEYTGRERIFSAWSG